MSSEDDELIEVEFNKRGTYPTAEGAQSVEPGTIARLTPEQFDEHYHNWHRCDPVEDELNVQAVRGEDNYRELQSMAGQFDDIDASQDKSSLKNALLEKVD